MDPFAKHGITHLSASSLRLYREQPALWCLKYLGGVKDEAGPAAWRGQAVEAGLDRLLWGYDLPMASAEMKRRWDELAQGVADDAALKAFADLGGFLEQAQTALKGRPTPLTKQSKITVNLPGIEVPIIGYVDYRWPDYGLDLKTTMRMPSEPNASHVEQVSLYAKATGVPFFLLYVSPKKHAIHEVTAAMGEAAMKRVHRGALAIRHMLEKARDAQDALHLFNPDFGTYHWNQPLIEAADRLYGAAA